MIKLWRNKLIGHPYISYTESEYSPVSDVGFFITKEELEKREKEIAERAFERGKQRLYVCRTETVNAGNASTVQSSSPETFNDYWQQVKGEG